MLKLLQVMFWGIFITATAFAGESSVNGIPGDVFTQAKISDISVEHKIATIFSYSDNENDPIPVMRTKETIKITNNSNAAKTINMGIPIWYADPAFSPEKEIFDNLNMQVAVNDKSVKLAAPKTYTQSASWFGKIFSWNVNLAAKQTSVIEISYDLFISSSGLNTNTDFSEAEAKFDFGFGPLLGVRGLYMFGQNFEYGEKLAGKTKAQFHVDISELPKFLANETVMLAFLNKAIWSEANFQHVVNVMQKGKDVEPPTFEAWDSDHITVLRQVMFDGFPPQTNNNWVYDFAANPNEKPLNYEFYLLNLPVTLKGMQNYYADYVKTHEKEQIKEWKAWLLKNYQEAYIYPINDQAQIKQILDFLNKL